MIINKINNFDELENYQENLMEEIINLKDGLNGKKRILIKKLKKERYEIIRAIRDEIKSLKKSNSETLKLKKQELEEKRNELYLKRDEVIADLVKKQSPQREKLQKMEEEYQEISEIIEEVKKLRANRTFEEYLNLVIKLLKEMGKEDYSIRIFNKDFTYVGIGTHSDYPQYTETRNNGVVAIAKNELDLTQIPEEVISWPEENKDYYESGDFILFKKFEKPIEENAEFLTELTYISSNLPGMNAELTNAIDNEFFKEYKKSLNHEVQKVNK